MYRYTAQTKAELVVATNVQTTDCTELDIAQYLCHHCTGTGVLQVGKREAGLDYRSQHTLYSDDYGQQSAQLSRPGTIPGWHFATCMSRGHPIQSIDQQTRIHLVR